jgi:hypothetical protein
MRKFKNTPLPEAFQEITSDNEWDAFRSWYFDGPKGKTLIDNWTGSYYLSPLVDIIFERVKEKVRDEIWQLEGVFNDTSEFKILDSRLASAARYYAPTNQVFVDGPNPLQFSNVVISTLQSDHALAPFNKPKIRNMVDKWIAEFALRKPGRVKQSDALKLCRNELSNEVNPDEVTTNLFADQWREKAPSSIKLKGAPRK